MHDESEVSNLHVYQQCYLLFAHTIHNTAHIQLLANILASQTKIAIVQHNPVGERRAERQTREAVQRAHDFVNAGHVFSCSHSIAAAHRPNDTHVHTIRGRVQNHPSQNTNHSRNAQL